MGMEERAVTYGTNGSYIPAQITTAYVHVRQLREGEHVARTVEVLPGELMVDVDADGAVLGIETIGKMVDIDTLYQIVRAVRWAA
jgi:uncharacterized protein YuzE